MDQLALATTKPPHRALQHKVMVSGTNLIYVVKSHDLPTTSRVTARGVSLVTTQTDLAPLCIGHESPLPHPGEA